MGGTSELEENQPRTMLPLGPHVSRGFIQPFRSSLSIIVSFFVWALAGFFEAMLVGLAVLLMQNSAYPYDG